MNKGFSSQRLVGRRPQLAGSTSQQLRYFVDQAPAAIAMLDLDLRYLAASSRWRTYFCPAGADIVGRAHEQVFPELPAQWREIYRRALAGETLTGEEDVHPRADGRLCWVRWEARPWRDSDGIIGGVMLAADDMTAKVEAMRALRQSRDDHNRAQKVAHVGSWRIDLVRNVLVWSDENRRIFGLADGVPPTDQTFFAVVHPDDRERVTAAWQAALDGAPLEGASYEIEHRIIVHGELKWVRSRAELERDALGRAVSAFGTTQDITESKRIEEALRESEERLRLCVEAAGIGTFTVDVAARMAVYAPELALMLGFPDARSVPLEAALARVHRDDAERTRAQFEAALASDGSGPLRMEFRFVRPGGEVRWMTWNGRVELREKAGRRVPWRILGACVDITERKSAETALVAAKADLERRVAERAAELEREMRRREIAQAALAQSQRLESVGRLAGGIAHDFNNTLAAISANLELAIPHISDPRALEAVQSAMQAVEISAGLNRRLSTFTRRTKPLLLPTQINDRVAGIFRLLERTLGGDVVLSGDLAPDLWLARLDPGELDSALLNLALNARDAMPKGGKLSIETRNVHLDSATLPPGAPCVSGDHIRLSVRDSGTGMGREVLKRALEPFFTTKGSDKRTGLGLSSVGEFARGSGGFVLLDSVVGSGTTVSLYLPRAPGETAAGGSARKGEVPLGDGELVLLVDDNDRLLEAEYALLEGLGYAVATASSGPQAIAVLESGAPVRLVLSDIVMPGGMSGYDVAREVLTRWPGTGVVLASGYHDIEVPEGDAYLAEVSVLHKPHSRAELAGALRAALARGAQAGGSRRASPANT